MSALDEVEIALVSERERRGWRTSKRLRVREGEKDRWEMGGERIE
jgi:hypothetical protein